MERSYLEFEKPIEEIKKQISQTLKLVIRDKLYQRNLKELEDKLSKTTKKSLKT